MIGRCSMRAAAVVLGLAVVLAGCGDDDTADDTGGDGGAVTGTAGSVAVGPPPTPPDTSPAAEPVSITLVTYDSFPEADTSLNDALTSFGERTGITVDILVAGDTGTMLSKAALTAGNPEGDVMWGVDNTFISRAVDEDVFEPYLSPMREVIPDDLLALVPNGQATPVDFGDVCVNYDIGWFEERQLDVPTSLDELTDPAYADLLVVQNPATSSPGLAFLLATIDQYGIDGWEEYWQDLVDNGVEVVDGWTEAYYERFTWAGGGPKPLVVSYGSSPPAEVIFADPPRDDAPTGVVESTCFRQVEFAGVLRGTDQPDEARQLVDFLVSEEFQAELPLSLFVYPANETVELPPEFVEFTVVPDVARSVDPDRIESNREQWIDTWTELVLG